MTNSAHLVQSVRRPLAAVYRVAAAHPEHIRGIESFERANQVLAVAEMHLTLMLISAVRLTVGSALVVETVSRAITMAFKMLPRIGVDEASSSVFGGHLDLGAAAGLMVAPVRKLRLLFWRAAERVFLMARRSHASTIAALSWPVAGQRVL